MISYEDFFSHIAQSTSAEKFSSIKPNLEKAFSHGDYPFWQGLLDSLPDVKISDYDFNSAAIELGKGSDLNRKETSGLRNILTRLKPWRKGPYNILGNYIDTEWRSDLKWARVQPHISDLTDRSVLDVGCGSGYHCWRMRGGGASTVIGVETYLLSIIQFNVLKKYLYDQPVWALPLRMEEIPQNLNYFDTIFSMGLLYHQRSPFDHLFHLKSALRAGGELILETLVIEGKDGEVLVPDKSYAKMKNVWFIPSPLTLETWLKRTGFKNIRLIDVTKTNSNEQRKTAWMQYESLNDFLDPADKDKTIEGYPAPVRAIFIAEK